MSKKAKAKLCVSSVSWREALFVVAVVVTVTMLALIAAGVVSVIRATFIGISAAMLITGVITLQDRWAVQHRRYIGTLTPYEEPEKKKEW